MAFIYNVEGCLCISFGGTEKRTVGSSSLCSDILLLLITDSQIGYEVGRASADQGAQQGRDGRREYFPTSSSEVLAPL